MSDSIVGRSAGCIGPWPHENLTNSAQARYTTLMRPARGILRISAVISAVTLLGIYVYDQAGGKLVTLPVTSQPGTRDGRMLPGSKSAAVFDDAAPSPALPGSKSKVIFAPGTAAQLQAPPANPSEAPQSEPAVVVTSGPKRRTLPGSKAEIIFRPAQIAAEQAPNEKNPQAAEEQAPQAANEEGPFEEDPFE